MVKVHWRCVAYAVMGALTGCAAFAQDAAVGTQVNPPPGEIGTLVSLLNAGGLPTVLAISGWMLSKGGIPVTIQFSDADRTLVKAVARKLAAAMDEDGKKDDSLDEGGK